MTDYESSPTIRDLLAIPHPVALDAGSPDRAAGERLLGLDTARLFAPAPIRDPDMARACLAGLWLRFDFLDESHRISQELHSAEGLFWHAIMHRREGDYGNSKYWWRRVGNHPVFGPLRAEAQRLGVARGGAWDPFAFVDSVEACVTRGRGDEAALRSLQEREWQLLFEHCYRHAAGA